LWTQIAAQVGSSAATSATAGGMSMLSKWLIGIGISTAVTTGVIIVAVSGKEESRDPMAQAQQATEQRPEDTNELVEEKWGPTSEDERVTSEQLEDSDPIQNEEQRKSGDELPFDIQREHLVNHPRSATSEPITSPTDENTDGKPFGDGSDRGVQISDTKATGERFGTPSEGLQKSARGMRKDLPETPQREVAEQQPESAYRIGRLVNVFTPNNDDRNDFFSIDIDGVNDFSVVVLNVRNEVVFTSDTPDFKWDGIDQRTGEPVPPTDQNNRYMYFIIAKDNLGNPVRMSSHLTISR